MKWRLITEQSNKINPGKNKKKTLFLEGVFSSAETRNNNGRWYPKDILKEAVDKVMPKVKAGRLFGQLGHPETPNTNVQEICMLIDKLTWRGNDLLGRAKVLSTPAGKLVKTIVDEGGQVSISSRGAGQVSEEGVVESGYKIFTWDCLVGNDPGNDASWVNGVYEGQSFSMCQVNEALQQEIDPAEILLSDTLQLDEANPDHEESEIYSEYHFYQFGDATSNDTPNRSRLGKKLCKCECGHTFVSVKNKPCSDYYCPQCATPLQNEEEETKKENFTKVHDVMDDYVEILRTRRMWYG
jgi:hypothetical protein